MTFSYLGGKRWSSSSRSVCGSFQPVTVPGLAMTRSTAKLLQKLPREIDQSVVAGAHDHDSVAGLGFRDQRVADLCALRDMLGLSPALAHLLGEPVAAARLFDRAALVDRIGQIEPV